jgi:hypothetical protein
VPRDRATIAIKADTRERLNERKPYDSTTYDEVITELLDATEDADDLVGRFN